MGSKNGINSIGNTGNIQTAVRGFNSGANYIFNAKGDQVTGTFATLPKVNTVNTIKFSSTGKVTLFTNLTTTVTGIAPHTLSLLNGFVDLNGYNLTIPNNATVNGSGGNFTGTKGTLVFAGTGTVTGNITFSNVLISKAVDLGNGSAIGNSLVINPGGVVVNNSPVYATKSSLIYNAGSYYRRSLEWSATSGKGYPYNVIIKGGTTLDLSANGFADRAIAGNLIVGLDSSTGSLTMGAMPNKLTIGGNIAIGGTNNSSSLILSNKPGGDLYIGGHWIRNVNGLFTDFGRNITFMGNGDQTISGTDVETFSYLKIDKPAGNILLTTDLKITKSLSFLSTNNGLVATQNKTLTIANGNPTSIIKLGNGYIIGNLKRAVSAGANLAYKFPTGTIKGYTPVTITFNSVTSPGYLSATSIDNDHPLLTPYIARPKTINRYWKLTGDSLQYNTYKARFEFLAADKDSLANTSYFIIGKYTDATWSFPLVTSKKPDYTEATDINGFGDFQIGQQGCATPTINASITQVACADSANASIFVSTSGGTTPLTYAWTGPTGFTSSVASITNLSAGKYVLTTTAYGGCEVTKEFQVTQPSRLLVTANSSSNITCKGGTTTLTVSASGGTGAYQYTLSNGSSTTAPQPNNNFTVSAGTYTVAVSDSNGCSVTSSSITVTQPEALIANVNAGTITCNAGTTTLTVSASGGTGAYQYTLSNGSSTTAPQPNNNFTVLAGTYTITIVDENLCSFSSNQITINEPIDLQVSITIDPMICPDTVTTIHISAIGGTGSFTYNVYDGANVSPFQNDSNFIVRSGTYTITVKDGNGCKKSSQITVNPCGLPKSINITQYADFKIKVYPNPSASDFILNVQSNSDDPLRIIVFDALGRIVGQFYGSSTKKYSFGNNLTFGTYYLQVKQGKNRQLKTIIKKG